jgi:hypothetical protein
MRNGLILDPAIASHLAQLALLAIGREYPNKLDHVLNYESEVQTPRRLHPAFYGCFDWHSSVHGHWTLVRLLRLYPHLPEAQEMRAALAGHLTPDNILAEKAYLEQPSRQSFERTYGWAWLLKLAEDLYSWDDPEGNELSRNLQPLADSIVARYFDFLPRQTYPVRTGTHPNTAFGLAFALDYARTVGHDEFERLLVERSLAYFWRDVNYPAAWEPNGNDFLSPCLIEADLMWRVLPPNEFAAWLGQFLPRLSKGEPESLFRPVLVADRTDPQIVHLDGLNLSRAWCMRNIASALSGGSDAADEPIQEVLMEAAELHAKASLPHVASGDYMGEHWLASFAVYMLSKSSQR